MTSSLFGVGNFILAKVDGTIASQQFTATAGQTLFTLTNFAYEPGTNSIMVFVNGSKKRAGVDFNETSTSTFSFVAPLTAGTIVEVIGFPELDLTLVNAANITYTPPGSTQTRNIIDKLKDFEVSIFDYMSASEIAAVRAGTTNAALDVSLAAAITYVITRAQAGTVVLPSGLYKFNKVLIPANVTIRGEGVGNTVINPIGSLDPSQPMFYSGADAGSITFQDFTIDGLNGTQGSSLINLNNCGSNILFERLEVKNWAGEITLMAYPAIKIRNFVVKDCLFYNLPIGCLIVAGASINARGSSDFQFLNNTLDTCGGNCCSVRDFESGLSIDTRFGFYKAGLVQGNVILNVTNTGPVGPYVWEWWGFEDLMFLNNYVDGSIAPLTAGANNINVLVANNIFKNVLAYACEGAGRNISIYGNLVLYSAGLMQDTSASIAGSRAIDATTIENNTIIGSCFSSAPVNPAYTIWLGQNGFGLPLTSTVRNNVFYDQEFVFSVINISGQLAAPIIEFPGNPGSGATISAYTLRVNSVRLLSRGQRYSTAPTVTFIRNDTNVGTSATGVANIDPINGWLTGITITNPGSNYAVPPRVQISGGGGIGGDAEAICGIMSVTLTGGTGYTAGNWTLSNNGSGTNATGTITVSAGVPTVNAVTTAGDGFGRSTETTIENNTYYSRTFQSSMLFIQTIGNAAINNNKFYRSAAYTPSHFQAPSGPSVFYVQPNPSPLNRPRTRIVNNTIECTATSTAVCPPINIVNNYGASHYGLLIANNTVRGNFGGETAISLSDTAGRSVVRDNDFSDYYNDPTQFYSAYNGVTGSASVLQNGVFLMRQGEWKSLADFKVTGPFLRVVCQQDAGLTRVIKIRRNLTTGVQTPLIANIRYVTANTGTAIGADIILAYHSDTATASPIQMFKPTLQATYTNTGQPTISNSTAGGIITTTITPPTSNRQMVVDFELILGSVWTSSVYNRLDWSEYSISVGV